MRRGIKNVVDAHLCRGLDPFSYFLHQVFLLCFIGHYLEVPGVWLIGEGSKKREVKGEAMLGMERGRESLELCEGDREVTRGVQVLLGEGEQNEGNLRFLRV